MMRRAVGAWNSLTGDRVWYAPIPRRPRKQQGSSESTAFNQPRRSTASEIFREAVLFKTRPHTATVPPRTPKQWHTYRLVDARQAEPPHRGNGGDWTGRRQPIHDCNLLESGSRPFALEASLLNAPPVAERQGYGGEPSTASSATSLNQAVSWSSSDLVIPRRSS